MLIMATNNSLKNQLIEKEQSTVNVQETMFKNLINSDEIKSKFTEVLKDKATGYMNSIINLVNGDQYMKETPTPEVIGVSDSHKRQAFGSLLKESTGYCCWEERYLYFLDENLIRAQRIWGVI